MYVLPWIILELNALIFYYNFFFYSRYLKNYFDLCCKAFITLFLSYSIFFFYYSNCSNCTNFVLSINTLFFYSSSDLSFFSSFSYFLIRAFWSKSSFIAGLFLMLFARCANFREERDSWNAYGAGDIIVNIVVLQLPPKLSLNKRVSKQFLYGMWAGVLFYVNAEMTIPRQLKLLLIFLH